MFWIHVADRLWEVVALRVLTVCLTLSECPPRHSAHLHSHEMGYGSLWYKVVSIKVYSVEEQKVPFLGLKNEEYSPKMFFLLTWKLYLKWTENLCNFIVRVRIETTVFQEMRLITLLNSQLLKYNWLTCKWYFWLSGTQDSNKNCTKTDLKIVINLSQAENSSSHFRT